MVDSPPSLLLTLLQESANTQCADCQARHPKWASVNLGVFICECCAGVHRNLGTHISQVRSVKLDTWKPEWVKTMALVGNARAKAMYECSVPAEERYTGSAALAGGDRLDVGDAKLLERWIRAKYEEKRYYAPAGAAGDTKKKKRHARGAGCQEPSGAILSTGSTEGWSLPGTRDSWASTAPTENQESSWAKASSDSTHDWRLPATGDSWVSTASTNCSSWAVADPWAASVVVVADAPLEQSLRVSNSKMHRHKRKERAQSVHGISNSHVGGGWGVDVGRLTQYKAAFTWADLDRDGLLSLAEVREVLETSGLRPSELSQIWRLSDVGEDGQLCLGEFVCAMHLTYRRWQGVPLPKSLPQELLAIAQNLPQPQQCSRNI